MTDIVTSGAVRMTQLAEGGKINTSGAVRMTQLAEGGKINTSGAVRIVMHSVEFAQRRRPMMVC